MVHTLPFKPKHASWSPLPFDKQQQNLQFVSIRFPFANPSFSILICGIQQLCHDKIDGQGTRKRNSLKLLQFFSLHVNITFVTF